MAELSAELGYVGGFVPELGEPGYVGRRIREQRQGFSEGAGGALDVYQAEQAASKKKRAIEEQLAQLRKAGVVPGIAGGGTPSSAADEHAANAVAKTRGPQRAIDKPLVDATVTPGSERGVGIDPAEARRQAIEGTNREAIEKLRAQRANPNAPIPTEAEANAAQMARMQAQLDAGAAAGETQRPIDREAEARANSLSVAWGGREPVLVPGGEMTAPANLGRPTIDTMVRDPATGNLVQAHESRGGGGYAPSQMDWSKVANPWGFEAYRQKAAAAGAPEGSSPETVGKMEKIRDTKIAEAQTEMGDAQTAKRRQIEMKLEQEEAVKRIQEEMAEIEAEVKKNQASGGGTGVGLDPTQANVQRRAVLLRYLMTLEKMAPGSQTARIAELLQEARPLTTDQAMAEALLRPKKPTPTEPV